MSAIYYDSDSDYSDSDDEMMRGGMFKNNPKANSQLKKYRELIEKYKKNGIKNPKKYYQEQKNKGVPLDYQYKKYIIGSPALAPKKEKQVSFDRTAIVPYTPKPRKDLSNLYLGQRIVGHPREELLREDPEGEYDIAGKKHKWVTRPRSSHYRGETRMSKKIVKELASWLQNKLSDNDLEELDKFLTLRGYGYDDI